MNLKNEVAAVAAWMEKKASEKVEDRRKDSGEVPSLTFVFQDGDAPSERYVKQKVKACARVGIDSILAPYRLDQDNPEDYFPLLWEVMDANTFSDGVIVQSPFPEPLDRREVFMQVAEHINAEKDVDGAYTRGRFMPCTALGIFFLLRFLHGESLAGRTAVVFGRGVGLSIAEMLSRQLGMSVITLNSKSSTYMGTVSMRLADVVVSAMGTYFPDIPARRDQVFIDVGFRVGDDGLIRGDLHDYRYLEDAFYTPVPGGVGKLTVAALMLNAAYGYSPIELADSMRKEISDAEI